MPGCAACQQHVCNVQTYNQQQEPKNRSKDQHEPVEVTESVLRFSTAGGNNLQLRWFHRCGARRKQGAALKQSLETSAYLLEIRPGFHPAHNLEPGDFRARIRIDLLSPHGHERRRTFSSALAANLSLKRFRNHEIG